MVMGDSFAGVTEIRPGVFTFFDLFQMQLGICSFADIALSVLTTVTSHKVDRKTKTQRMFIDAGGLALSKDRSTQGQTSDLGYGQVIGLNGETLSQPVIVNAVNQEHGVIDLPNALSLDDFPIGSRLRILPNHACMTAAAHDGYHVLSPEGELSWWSRCNGW